MSVGSRPYFYVTSLEFTVDKSARRADGKIAYAVTVEITTVNDSTPVTVTWSAIDWKITILLRTRCPSKAEQYCNSRKVAASKE